MRGAPLGRAHEHHASLASTNDHALAWARRGAPHGALVTADEQTAGRGRLGRRWVSPPGEGLYASLVLRPATVTGAEWSPRWAALGLAVGLGLREGLARWLPELRLKWPNDLLCGGRKLGGVLCETRWQGAVPDVVTGFGINVLQREFPAELAATSLAIELAPGTCPSRQEVLRGCLDGLQGVLAGFFAGGFPAIREAYERHSAVVDRALTVGGRAVVGVGFDDDGALRVRGESGESRRVEAEDVWLREPG
jgi:BirA family transcriptional regulator, biotin operon repressor / biotin---[acetyl-CoA-carboxylase] ligase